MLVLWQKVVGNIQSEAEVGARPWYLVKQKTEYFRRTLADMTVPTKVCELENESVRVPPYRWIQL